MTPPEELQRLSRSIHFRNLGEWAASTPRRRMGPAPLPTLCLLRALTLGFASAMLAACGGESSSSAPAPVAWAESVPINGVNIAISARGDDATLPLLLV